MKDIILLAVEATKLCENDLQKLSVGDVNADCPAANVNTLLAKQFVFDPCMVVSAAPLRFTIRFGELETEVPVLSRISKLNLYVLPTINVDALCVNVIG